ncbi:hypothetical protein HWV62_12799 [Athelia sp. TMB]|nr:hypothetical protein HWV62_12799 [Athelia sp. TMB]
MEIIEIDSSPAHSPEPAPRPLPKRRNSRQPPAQKRARRVAPVALNPEEIIELTDTESDDGNAIIAALIRKSKDSMVISGPEPVISGAGQSSRQALKSPPRPSRDPAPSGTSSIPADDRQPLFIPEDEEMPEAGALAQPPPPLPVAPPIPRPIIVIPDVEPEPETEPLPPTMDTLIARVLEIVSDVQPAHVLSLLEQHATAHKNELVEFVLHALFEDPNYPKIDKKGKRRREDTEEPEGKDRRKSIKIDYGSKDRERVVGPHYADIALEALLQDFPYIPKPHVRRVFFANNALYAPSYLFLAEERNLPNLPYVVKSTPSRPGKGKLKEDPEFEQERAWLVAHLLGDLPERDGPMAESLPEEEPEECVDGIECGCCFSAQAFDKMVQCPDCHLFCTECMTSYASNLLGARNNAIVCMDQSGCKLPFPESELKRFLTPKLLALYERVTQQKEIEAAGLEGLEECPFCEYKIIIDNPDEKLFRCENADCGAVSCRACKKTVCDGALLLYIQRTLTTDARIIFRRVARVEDDKKLDARHLIEEAMTRALMRNCPKCQKAFVKEHGVRKAAQEAVDEYKRQNPNLTDEELKAIEVELPPAPAPAPAVPAPLIPHLPPQAFGGQFPVLPNLDFGAGMLAQHHVRMHAMQQAQRAQQAMALPDEQAMAAQRVQQAIRAQGALRAQHAMAIARAQQQQAVAHLRQVAHRQIYPAMADFQRIAGPFGDPPEPPLNLPAGWPLGLPPMPVPRQPVRRRG